MVNETRYSRSDCGQWFGMSGAACVLNLNSREAEEEGGDWEGGGEMGKVEVQVTEVVGGVEMMKAVKGRLKAVVYNSHFSLPFAVRAVHTN